MFSSLVCGCGESRHKAAATYKRYAVGGSVTLLALVLVLGLWGCAVEGLQGPPGPQGEPGDMGQDARGIPGVPGTQGLQGAPGEIGSQGPVGETGLEGPGGGTGPEGPTGGTGPEGPTGGTGPEGPAGGTGPEGPQGPAGQNFEFPPGTPVVETLADATGGPLVVGDLLDISGASLDVVDVVLIGEQWAPIVTQAEDALRVQIPAGVTGGPNTMRLINFTADTGYVETLAAVNVHRLAVFMGSLSNRIVILDTTDDVVVARIDRDIATMPSDIPNPPYAIDLANHGSLALLPTGDGELTWIDLTTVVDESVVPVNGVVDLHPGQANDPANMTTIGVTVSPDNQLAVVADERRGQLWAVTIDEAFPPYANPLTPPDAPSLTTPPDSFPRSPAFASDTTLIVPYLGAGDLAVIERAGSTLTLTDTVAAGVSPSEVFFVPERATLLTATRGDHMTPAALAAFLVGGTTVGNPLNVNLELTDLWDFAATRSGNFAYTIALNSNLVNAVLVADTAMAPLGVSDPLSSSQARCLAVEPVSGNSLYVGLNSGDFVDVFDIVSGGTLSRRAAHPLLGDPDLQRCFGIGFQP